MRIQRNYSQPFFNSRRKRSTGGRFLFLFGLLIGVFLMFVYVQFDRLQMAALNLVGMAPTATPFASDYANQGMALFTKGDVNGAASMFATAVQLQPNNVNYLYEYGRMLIELDKSDEAVPLAERAMQVAADDPRGYALKARALMWSDPASAIPIAVNGLEVDPNFAPLHSALAIAYTNIGRYQQGLISAQQAIALDPMDADAHRSYSYTLIYVGRYKQAIEQLEEAIAINPNLTAPYFELAGQYKRQNEEEMAVAIYRHILELQPNNAKAYLRLCETYAAVGQFQQAQPFCEQAIEIDPNYASAYKVLGQMQYSRRNYEGSIESFQTCERLGSKEIECWYIRGLAHYFLGQCDQAWQVLNEALPMAELLPDKDLTIENIRIGLTNITIRCPGYAGRALPTVPPPTTIPPTPIGGGN